MALPGITAVANPVAGNVYLRVDWSTIPSATYAAITRIRADGVSALVRMNTSTDTSGNYIELSGGQAIVYDTECPLDLPVTYLTTALTAAGVSPTTGTTTLVYEDFESGLVGWSTSAAAFGQSPSHPYAGTRCGDLTVTSSTTQAYARKNTSVTAGSLITFSGFFYSVPGIASGNSYLSIDWLDVNGSYISSSGVTATLSAATWTPLIFSVNAPSNAATASFGPTLFGSPAIGTELFVDNLLMTTPAALTSATSTEVILQSSQRLWLRDPVNPFNNVQIGLTPPSYASPDCVPGEGIFFAPGADQNLGTQSTNFSVSNRSTPLPLNQVRAAATSTLNLILRTFGDEDVLTALLSNGTPLLLDVPAQYGISRRFINIGDLTLSRVSSDMRRQWQFAGLPYARTSRPGGLAYGTLGTRWADLCTPTYPTFADATNAGVTWAGVLAGWASSTRTAMTFRTWGSVNTDFANWIAVNNGRTWQQLLVGQ